MNRAVAKKAYRIGLSLWLATVFATFVFKWLGVWPAAWPVVVFPLWGPPAAYVAFVLSCWALGIAVVILAVLLKPWLR